jgi:hypothetical protein
MYFITRLLFQFYYYLLYIFMYLLCVCRYACKTMLIEQKSYESSVLKEVEILRCVRHPFIVDIRDVYILNSPRYTYTSTYMHIALLYKDIATILYI